MADISPVRVLVGDVVTVTWTGITTTTDTPLAYGPMLSGKGARYAAVTFGGTFNGGTTAVLQGSNDGTTWATLTDIAGNAISATAAKVQEFSSSVLYLRPAVSGGSADNVNVVVALRN